MPDLIVPGWVLTHTFAFVAGFGFAFVLAWSLALAREGDAEDAA